MASRARRSTCQVIRQRLSGRDSLQLRQSPDPFTLLALFTERNRPFADACAFDFAKILVSCFSATYPRITVRDDASKKAKKNTAFMQFVFPAAAWPLPTQCPNNQQD
jgi:hypothetical protein